MTKTKAPTKKKKPPSKTQDPAAETETLELSDAQVYEGQLRVVIDEWTEASIEDLEEKIRALDLPKDGRKFQPHTSKVSRQALRQQGERLTMSWHIPPPRPPAAPMAETLKTNTGLDRAGFYDSDGRRVE